MSLVKNRLTIEEFQALPEVDLTYELVEGEAIPKMPPKRFHSRVTGALFILLNQWFQERGREFGLSILRREASHFFIQMRHHEPIQRQHF
jgi:Uma2 family endonuclease